MESDKPVFVYDIGDADDNQKVEILKELAHIRFNNLNILWVWGNKIESIEGLSQVHMPQIRGIGLSTFLLN